MRAGIAVLLLFLASFRGCLSQSVLQSKLSIVREAGKTARFRCVINTEDFDNIVVHWYRNTLNLGLQRILYIQANSEPVRDKGSPDRFTAENLVKLKTSLLDIRDIEEMDAGAYYCAVWESTVRRRRRSPKQIPRAQATLQIDTRLYSDSRSRQVKSLAHG